MTEKPSSSPFDVAPMWKTYMESADLWKKNYDAFLNAASEAAAKTQPKADAKVAEEKEGPDSSSSFFEGALWHWQKSGEELFKSFVQNQIELCDFVRDRLGQYMKLPEKLSQCNSVEELAKLQSAFLQEFANDYTREMEKRAQPVADLARQAAQVGAISR